MSKSKRKQIRERQHRRKIRANLIWGTLGIVVVVIIGLFVWQGSRSAASVGEQVEVSPDYINHIEEGIDPGPYPSNPPAGGKHFSSELNAGFYDENSPQTKIAYPEGYIGHNLEHGYVVFWYNCASLSETECNTLKSEIESVMDDFGGVKLIAFPWPSLENTVAMTSWGRLQRFDTFDPKIAADFIKANRNKAPEPNAQ